MADNTPQNGTASVASDDITTTNGGATTSAQAQRIKIDSKGVDGAFTDTSEASPFPIREICDIGVTFRGRASTFRTVGRAGTVARRLLTIWNPAGSGKVVTVNQLAVDFAQLAAIAVTVIPPAIRVYRITAAPTGGTALTKNAKDTALTSAATIVLAGDASADGTNSASALAATTTAGAALTQEFFPRLITGAGYEVADRIELLADKRVIIRAGEGLVLSSDITLITQEPAGVLTIATIDWYEV